MKLTELTESETLNPPAISVGDEVKVGKFKNSKAEVKGFKKDDHGQPVLKTTKGDQKLYKPRVSKLEPGAVEEGDTKIEVDFDPSNYKSVIKTLQDREISGKQKAIFLKSRIMRKLKSGGGVSRKEVLSMMDNLK